MKKTYIIDPTFKGVSLRNFIKKKFLDYSTREIEALVAQNGCRLNNKIERFGSTKLCPGDTVEIFPQFLKPKEAQKPSVLYEDQHIIAINKPTGLASSQKEIEEALGQNVFLVHRLDKLTSGVLLLAKNKEAQQAIEQLFFKREIQKHYLAIVHGRIPEKSGTIDKPLQLKKKYEGGVLYQTHHFGKPAVTRWTKVTSSPKETLLQLEPITGRTHQLRVHLDAIEHPILGDPQYGMKLTSSYHAPRLMLHARKISFNHPFLNKKIEIIAPIPSILNQIISKLFKNCKKCAY